MANCEFCGGLCERWHHPTGKGENGRYLDPEFVRPTCHDHHELVHDDAQTLGWEKLQGRPLTWFERVELRLRRWAAFLGRLEASSTLRTPYAVLAKTLLRWADELARGIAALDEDIPGWRWISAFYPS
jgi:hypothetical protein